MSDGAIGGNDRAHFLDGLRGWAALAVALWHIFGQVFTYGPSAPATLGKLLLFDGIMPVCLFFMISGFSLSIGYVRRTDTQSLHRLAWSRYPRLAIPILFACLLVHLAMLYGVIPSAAERPFPLDRGLLFETSWTHLVRFSLFDVFFDFNPAKAYIIPLWTMPIELLGSFVVFLLLAGVGRQSWRLPVYVTAFVPLWVWAPHISLFVAGLIQAELYVRYPRATLPITIALYGAAIAGCLSTLIKSDDPSMLYIALVIGLHGAVIWLIPLRRFFETRLSRFLGHISFPLYLLHGPVMYSFSIAALSAIAPWGLGQATTNLVVGFATLLVSILVAMLFAPVNDASIALSRRFGAWAGQLSFKLASLLAIKARDQAASRRPGLS